MNQQGALYRYRRQVSKILESPQNRSYTVLGLTFIALTVFGAFAIRPTISTIITLNKKIAEGKEIERKMQTKIDTINSLQRQIYEYDRKVRFAENAYPSTSQIDNIIANIELIAKKYNLTVSSISPGAEITEEMEAQLLADVNAQSMSVILEGGLDDFQKFISHFENLPRQIYVNEIGFSTQEESDLYRLTLEIIFFNSLI